MAFEGVVASELYPCVLFYSSNPGEKVHDIHTVGIYFIRQEALLSRIFESCVGISVFLYHKHFDDL